MKATEGDAPQPVECLAEVVGMSALTAALLIFVLRCIDVSLGTVRLIVTVQSRRTLASLIGFFEVSIFITAVATVVNGPLSVLKVLGYGAGFAAGTYVGVTLDRRLALGSAMVRVITQEFGLLADRLTSCGFGVTMVEGRGGRGTPVGVVFTLVRRRKIPEVLQIVHTVDGSAIVSVQEIRQQFLGYFAGKRPAPHVPLAS